MTAKKAPSELTPPPLPYYVYRTASQQLPVYQIAKRGGNLHQTRIRKINGDVKKLRDDIQKALELKEGNIAINSITGHITIKVFSRRAQYFISEPKVPFVAKLIHQSRDT